ncbi:MAG: hypothetical protein D6718_06315, partial [Acidobacteria bacterium]
MTDELRTAPLRRLARAFLLAEDAGDALRGWLSVVTPPADVVLLAGEEGGEPLAAFRRDGEAWSALSLPPVPLGPPPDEAGPFDLDRVAPAAWADLLRSLGMKTALAVPLEAEPGRVLLLARAAGRFGGRERRRIADRAAWLGPALGMLARRERHADATWRASRELASLVELNAALARAAGLADAARAAATALIELLAPPAGAVRLALERGG